MAEFHEFTNLRFFLLSKGMESKVNSALWALDNGVSVVICNGMKYRSIRKIIDGEKVGTFFAKNTFDGAPAEILAKNGK